MYEYDLIVIGGGPGGYTAALHAAKLGLKTAVCEAREAGGTCLNRGCVPTKALLHAAEVYRGAVEGEKMGIHVDGVCVNLPELFAYKSRVTGILSAGVETLLKGAKVPLYKGQAQITAPHEVTVSLHEGGETALTAEHILIATGSVPAMPPIPGLDLPGVLTSDELLEGSETLYKSLVIIGGGVIGVELATFYAALGTEVTVVEGLDRLLPNLDRELGQNVALILKKQGVKVFTSAMVSGVEAGADGLTVNFTAKGKEGSASGEKVLCAIGRRPYYEGLFTDGLTPEFDGRRIKVNERYETSLPGIYAIGDVSARIQLAHVAAAEGTRCVDFICGKENVVDMNLVPSCIYCTPEIASVGMTDAEAKAAGLEVKVGKCVMGGNARTLIADPGRSFMKVVAKAETGEIVGAQLMCQSATDMISEIAQAMANHLTAAELLKAMRPHPTFEEALHDALEDLVAKLAK